MVKIIIWICILITGCKGEELRPSLSYEAGKGEVVAQINGIEIYASQVEEACRETGLPPREVLEKMIDEIVLADEAAGKDHLRNRTVVINWKKVLVQKILEDEVEKKVPEESVTYEDIKTFYVENYAGRGLLIEDVRKEIMMKLLVERRNLVYQELAKALEKESSAEIYYNKLKEVK